MRTASSVHASRSTYFVSRFRPERLALRARGSCVTSTVFINFLPLFFFSFKSIYSFRHRRAWSRRQQIMFRRCYTSILGRVLRSIVRIRSFRRPAGFSTGRTPVTSTVERSKRGVVASGTVSSKSQFSRYQNVTACHCDRTVDLLYRRELRRNNCGRFSRLRVTAFQRAGRE